MALPNDGHCQTSGIDPGQGPHRVTIICSDQTHSDAHGDRPGDPDAGLPAPADQDCQTTTEDQGHGERRVTVTCHDDGDHGDAGAHHVERRVTITRSDDDGSTAHQGQQHSQSEVMIDRVGEAAELPEPAEAPEAPGAPAPPRPPHPPHAPMLMMLFASAEEADTNHDGALSRDEFRAQQMRFFDASDANHDGRIRIEPPPMPPEPPAPPAPPEPPAPPALPH